MLKIIFNSAKSWLFTKHDPAILLEIMSPGAVGIVSAKCCYPASVEDDKKLITVLENSISKCGMEKTINLESITVAQKSLRSLAGKLTDKNQSLVDEITALFQTKGLSIFPMTIIDGKIEFYGGIPTEDMVVQILHNINDCKAA